MLRPDDALVTMCSPHIARGRRNLSAAFTRHLRQHGVPAFNVSLLPRFEPEAVKDLNHLPMDALRRADLPIDGELQRLVTVTRARGETVHRIHLAGDVSDVMANLWAWNERPPSAEWTKRSVQYFVFDARTASFAPSKFCSFIPAAGAGGQWPPATMTLELYLSLGEGDPRFDGHIARRHLEDRLAFGCIPLEGSGHEDAFDAWFAAQADRLSLRRPVHLLMPPGWY